MKSTFILFFALVASTSSFAKNVTLLAIANCPENFSLYRYKQFFIETNPEGKVCNSPYVTAYLYSLKERKARDERQIQDCENQQKTYPQQQCQQRQEAQSESILEKVESHCDKSLKSLLFKVFLQKECAIVDVVTVPEQAQQRQY
jgi:hypothetical protein